jgi:DNA end-binding protein Ku
MARASWQGYLALGQLGIPIRLYKATQSLQPRFVLLHEADGSPVSRSWRCEQEQRYISHSDTVRAIQTEPGQYITLTDRELEQSAVGPVKTVSVKQFCATTAIAPLYYEQPFYMVPSRGGERAYALLREALTGEQALAVCQFSLRTNEHIGALGVHGDLLMLYQLRFAAEIVPRSSLKTPSLPKPSPGELSTLTAVIQRYNSPFYIEDYHDEYSEHIRELIERKRQGLPAPRQSRPAPHATPEADITATLQQALRQPIDAV